MLNHGQTDRAEELLRGFARKNGVNLLTTNFQPYFSALVDKLKDEAKESRRYFEASRLISQVFNEIMAISEWQLQWRKLLQTVNTWNGLHS